MDGSHCCSNCEHWERDDDPVEDATIPDEFGRRECSLIAQWTDLQRHIGAKSKAVVSDKGKRPHYPWTAGDFGCVGWAVRSLSPE